MFERWVGRVSRWVFEGNTRCVRKHNYRECQRCGLFVSTTEMYLGVLNAVERGFQMEYSFRRGKSGTVLLQQMFRQHNNHKNVLTRKRVVA